jgi:hypothetical protein
MDPLLLVEMSPSLPPDRVYALLSHSPFVSAVLPREMALLFEIAVFSTRESPRTDSALRPATTKITAMLMILSCPSLAYRTKALPSTPALMTM